MRETPLAVASPWPARRFRWPDAHGMTIWCHVEQVGIQFKHSSYYTSYSAYYIYIYITYNHLLKNINKCHMNWYENDDLWWFMYDWLRLCTYIRRNILKHVLCWDLRPFWVGKYLSSRTFEQAQSLTTAAFRLWWSRAGTGARARVGHSHSAASSSLLRNHWCPQDIVQICAVMCSIVVPW